MDRIEIIRHKGRKVYKITLGHLPASAAIDLMKELRKQFEQETEPYCTLWDIRDFYVNETFKNEAKALADFTRGQGIATGAATVGLTRIKRVIAQVIKSDMYWANDMDDALDWLTKDISD